MSSQSSTGSGKSIFISYRREDSQDVTGRIYDRLIQKFNPESIFKDVDAIPIGVDFRKHLEQQVAGCKVLLAIVGQRWVGNERLKEEGDFVRIEIEYGLDPVRGILLVPVLVGNATMPPVDQLPSSLKDFPFLNAIQVRPDPDFHKDMDKLIKSLMAVMIEELATPSREAATTGPSHKPYKLRGKELFEPKELAIYLSENWIEGVKQLGRGLIADWVRSDYKDRGMFSDLADIADDAELDADLRLSAALLAMNEELPLFWKGEVVDRDWLANNPEQAVEILNGPLPSWQDKLTGKSFLKEIRDHIKTKVESVLAVGVPVDLAKLDGLILQNEEEQEARFRELWQKFKKGEYAGIKHAPLQALMLKGEIGPVEQLALLCCDEDLFFTPLEKYRLDAMEYLKGFEVDMDWGLAEELIASNSWEKIKPLWQKVSSQLPLVDLKGNERIKSIFMSQNAEYLDVVALVAFVKAAIDKLEAETPEGKRREAERLRRLREELVGTCLWEFETGGAVLSSPAIGADGTVYVGSEDKKIYALDGKTGAKKWEYVTGFEMPIMSTVSSSPAIGLDGTVYVGSGLFFVDALDALPSENQWGFSSSPVIGPDGTIYVGNDNNKIYAIASSSNGPAKSPWPMRGQNVQHTGRAPKQLK